MLVGPTTGQQAPFGAAKERASRAMNASLPQAGAAAWGTQELPGERRAVRRRVAEAVAAEGPASRVRIRWPELRVVALLGKPLSHRGIRELQARAGTTAVREHRPLLEAPPEKRCKAVRAVKAEACRRHLLAVGSRSGTRKVSSLMTSPGSRKARVS